MIHEHGGVVNMDLDEKEKSNLKYSSLEEESESPLEDNPFEFEEENKNPDENFSRSIAQEPNHQLSPISTHYPDTSTSEEIGKIQSPLESSVLTEAIRNTDLRSEFECPTMKDPIMGVSRFYVTKKVIVGNVSRYIPPGKERETQEGCRIHSIASMKIHTDF